MKKFIRKISHFMGFMCYEDPLEFDVSMLDDEKYLFRKREQILKTIKVSLKNYSIEYLEIITGRKKPEEIEQLRNWEIEAESIIRVDLAYQIVEEQIKNLQNKNYN